jgi:hypothetical protein
LILTATFGTLAPQSYLAVEGGPFRSKEHATLIPENVSADAFSPDPITLAPGGRPSSIESISMPDIDRTDKLPAGIEHQDPAGSITITPFSVTRVVWE